MQENSIPKVYWIYYDFKWVLLNQPTTAHRPTNHRSTDQPTTDHLLTDI